MPRSVSFDLILYTFARKWPHNCWLTQRPRHAVKVSPKISSVFLCRITYQPSTAKLQPNNQPLAFDTSAPVKPLSHVPSCSLDFCNRYSPNTRKGSLGLLQHQQGHIKQLKPLGTSQASKNGTTYCSLANSFIPSNNTPVTLPLRYCLVGAPCGGASFGIVGAGSGCCEVALEFTSPFVFRDGVPILAGAGEGAFVAPGVAPGKIAGDYDAVSYGGS